eukprot:gene12891-14217_t
MVLNLEFKHMFHSTFEKVFQAYFEKYDGGKDPNVQSITVTEHWKDESKGIEYWKRIGKCSNVCPWFLRKFFTDPDVYFEEEMTLDLFQRTLKMHSSNLTFRKYLLLEETSKYYPSKDNPNWTQFKQSGKIDASGLGALGSLVERLAKSFLINGGNKRGATYRNRM